MRYKPALLIILLASVSLTVFGFWIDSDPRPPHFSTTVFEFFMMTGLVFTFLFVVFLILAFFIRTIRRL